MNVIDGVVKGVEQVGQDIGNAVSGIAQGVGQAASSVAQGAGQLLSNPLVDTALGSLVGCPELGEIGPMLGDLCGAAGGGQAGGLGGLLGSFGSLLGGQPPICSGFDPFGGSGGMGLGGLLGPGGLLGGLFGGGAGGAGGAGGFGGGFNFPQITGFPPQGFDPSGLGSAGNIGNFPAGSPQSQMQQLQNQADQTQLAMYKYQLAEQLKQQEMKMFFDLAKTSIQDITG